MGLVVDTVYEYEPSTYRDLVLDVKINGESVTPGQKVPVGTVVRLVVGFGQGTEQVEVPSVIGMTLQDARQSLLRHHLTVGAVSYDEENDGTPQLVYRQIPAAGERIVEGETVSLKLSKQIEKAVTGDSPAEDEWF
jgi:beta-lactam-binding protein with PASTA domain